MKRILLALVVSLLVFAGCTGFRRSPQDANPYEHTGTQGLEMAFASNRPPYQIYAGPNTFFDVMVEVRNKGTYTIQPDEADFELSGYDPDIITGGQIFSFRLEEPLEGKDQFRPDGTYALLDDQASYPVQIPDSIDKYPVDMLFTACYKYQTEASAMVCIDPEPSLASTVDKPCAIHDVSMGGGQGAPVGITRIEEQGSSDAVVFKIYVSNMGSGQVFGWPEYIYKAEYGRACARLEQMDMNIVRITNLCLGDQCYCSGSMDDSCSTVCKPGDKLYLLGGQAYAVCKLPAPWQYTGTRSAYNTPLRVTLEYGYTHSVMTHTEIIELK
jgi:hypothetical protein